MRSNYAGLGDPGLKRHRYSLSDDDIRLFSIAEQTGRDNLLESFQKIVAELRDHFINVAMELTRAVTELQHAEIILTSAKAEAATSRIFFMFDRAHA